MSAVKLAKYQSIKQSVLNEILGGRLRPGDKLPVRTELLKRYGTTRVTLDKALNELIAERFLTASRRTGTFVAPRGQAQRIAIISGVAELPGQLLQRYNYLDMYRQLKDFLSDRRVDTLPPSQVLSQPALLQEYDYILSNPLSEDELASISVALKQRERIIPLNRPFAGYNFVSTDHRQAMRDLTNLFLRELPPESEIIYLDVKFSEPLYIEPVPALRKSGFIDACAEQHRFYRLVNVRLLKHREYTEYNIADISELQALSFQGTTPACIISPSKCFTGAVLRHLHESGLRLNRDVYYADFDNYDSRLNTGYDITSVLEDFSGIAAAVAEMLDTGQLLPRFVPYTIINNPFTKRGEE
ncbi:MAG: GntR family transcriptional regulator [Oligosphaeraceae bacterium]|nr:GntR family transcriptional regulator [Oligosphaeraceae bacterium]